ncbi:hypothetical protein H4219_003857 [Mycoemilia scoparia]|uniref:L-2-hydroxyglutarate dehydrogenase, mitochondrial n=1 Tax=Mycoemilia scoparia TaxID=417184 RepID=A0A9W7ZTV8_9FUNG|nr:hypothetical protein H4219_003857 [Mycoemilia scoparia]
MLRSVLRCISKPQRSSYSTTTLPSAAVSSGSDFAVDHLVIGGGVVGLAIGRELAQNSSETTLVVEKNRSIGEETSSRNSEVIHAGIYYPNDSLKTKLCIEGKHLLYDYCQSRNIPHKKVGKWIVAHDEEQTSYLEKLQQKTKELGVETHMITKSEMLKNEPHIFGHSSLVSPTTGIIDTHSFMESLKGEIIDNGSDVALCSKVIAIEPQNNGKSGYYVTIETNDPDLPQMTIKSQTIINAAGLWSDKIFQLALQKDQIPNSPKLYYAKGRYYSYSGNKIKVDRLIYPVPDPNITTLGTHLTIDLGGKIKFGPDINWTDSPTDYKLTENEGIKEFVDAIKSYLPAITASDIFIDYAGIRPKLQPPGGKFHDFMIRNEAQDYNLFNFVNLLGIESPGLTSSLAIAKYTKGIIL